MAKLFAFLGGLAAVAGAGACVLSWFDEPEMPESLIK